jgi:hypothetical protein
LAAAETVEAQPGRTITANAPVVLAATFLLVTMAITGLTETPAMIDYLNHLARMELLASSAPNPAYEVRWEFIPDLAMDILIPPLAKLVGAGAATKAFLILSQALVVTGAVALERVAKGRFGLAGLVALPVLFSTPFGWGLLNFLFGLGLAVWGVAAWVALRERGPLLWIVHTGVVLALFVSHLFALALYGLVIGAIELSRLQQPEPRRLVRLAVPMAAPVGVLLGVMALSGASLGSDGVTWDFVLKALWPFRVLNPYDPMLGAVTGAALGGFVLALALTKRLSMSRTGVWISIVLVAVYLVIPVRLARSAYVDVRVIAAAMLVLPAFCRLSGRRALAMATLVAIIVVNGAGTFLLWQDRQSDYAQIRAALPLIERGSAVLVARTDAAALTDQPLYYAPTLAVPESGAFVSSFYAARGMQPVVARAPYRDLEVSTPIEYLPATTAELRTPHARHLVRWRERYRYLFVVGRPEANISPGLRRLAGGRRFVLYRIDDALPSSGTPRPFG